MLFTSVVTLVSCIFYVVGTYVSEKYSNVVVAVEACFAAVFFVDYILSVTAEAVSFATILSHNPHALSHHFGFASPSGFSPAVGATG